MVDSLRILSITWDLRIILLKRFQFFIFPENGKSFFKCGSASLCLYLDIGRITLTYHYKGKWRHYFYIDKRKKRLRAIKLNDAINHLLPQSGVMKMTKYGYMMVYGRLK